MTAGRSFPASQSMRGLDSCLPWCCHAACLKWHSHRQRAHCGMASCVRQDLEYGCGSVLPVSMEFSENIYEAGAEILGWPGSYLLLRAQRAEQQL